MKILGGGSAGSPSEQSDVSSETRRSGTKDCYNVLFLCGDNAIGSIMAEALLKRWGAQDFHAFSAGITPKGEIDPLAAELLKVQRVWHQNLRSKGCQEFLTPDAPSMDFIISLGEQPPAGMPTAWPGHPKVIHWHITEPVVTGRPAETTHSFRKAFGELENRVRLLVLVYQREALRGAAA
jgi:arsenate reductase (thioredoxin)